MFKLFKNSLKKQKEPVLGITFGGGGAKGSVHLGVLRAFEEEGISFQVVSGTSVGSLIGAMYARGLGWREIEGVLAAGGMSDFKTLLMSRVSGQGIVGVIDKMLDGMEFSPEELIASVQIEGE